MAEFSESVGPAVVGGIAGINYADPHATPQFLLHAGCWDDSSHTRLRFIPSSGIKPPVERICPSCDVQVVTSFRGFLHSQVSKETKAGSAQRSRELGGRR